MGFPIVAWDFSAPIAPDSGTIFSSFKLQAKGGEAKGGEVLATAAVMASSFSPK